ncbi:hypothetical protein FE257_000151 [Aspergillus nanangensis]|uniref:Arrestin-like N-terminal domain-containing protein n=1 Tax=Aspergillus nanangensis TaxID=2582783 RepID=A0AAD4CYZ9_ASPNN|nr:hypothetical protein FE257_000151 [Aspergillus nanangensis]
MLFTTPNPADLKFDIAAPPRWSYAAGDTIIGNLVRHSPVVSPEATVQIVLTGRAKVKITESTGNSRKIYRDEYRFLGNSPQVLFRGPLHLPEGSGESLHWPFEVKIPTEPLASARTGHVQAASFLPLDRNDHPAYHVLPGTFLASHEGLRTCSVAKVEYALKATLRYKFGSHKSHEATWPVTLRHPVVQTGIGYELTTMRGQKKVQSQRLVPGMENADLSLRQKTQKLFGSSKVPEFHYEIQLTVPRIIQLDDPQFLPIVIHILPLSASTSEAIRDVAQPVQINWVKFSLRSRTSVMAPSRVFSSYSHDDQWSSTLNLSLPNAFNALESPLTISTGKGNEPIHIGEVFRLGLHAGGLTSGDRYLSRVSGIYPDFVTHNIKHVHMQEWQVSLTIAGETQKHEFSAALALIESS